jgi:lysophospholipid acyltransferase (LPLAT)-like uncharacterized protein
MQASAEHEFKGARPAEETVARAYRFADLFAYPLSKRLLIRAADVSFYLLINVIARTIRWQVDGWENWEAVRSEDRVPIFAFWHNRLFLAPYFWQKRRIVVMTSQSFDGEYIARVLQRFGCGVARGSSTRGAVGALIEMVRLMRAECPTAFTVDGPKGPRYVAKMGAVLLAKKTGHPILPFTITARRYWESKRSWDRAQVPFPFTGARVDIAPPIFVRPGAGEEELAAKRDELQAVLDELNRRGLEWATQ